VPLPVTIHAVFIPPQEKNGILSDDAGGEATGWVILAGTSATPPDDELCARLS
jgi:hypothetical protein